MPSIRVQLSDCSPYKPFNYFLAPSGGGERPHPLNIGPNRTPLPVLLLVEPLLTASRLNGTFFTEEIGFGLEFYNAALLRFPTSLTQPTDLCVYRGP